jgi:hypothetical protein
VHHIIVYVREPNQRGFGGDISENFLTGTAPGDPPMILPPGVAKKIPAGSNLVFQMHYTPTGKEEKDRSEVGLVFYKAPEPPKHVAYTKGIMNRRISIPPGDANYLVESRFTFRNDGLLLNMMPHMHLRGKDFLFEAIYPDGARETLLSVPAYDFNWQNKYVFSQPKPMPKGTVMHCVAHFDNSPGNPANPDATKTVRWGDQTWEEMMIGWIDYIWAEPDAAAATGDTKQGEQVLSGERASGERGASAP